MKTHYKLFFWATAMVYSWILYAKSGEIFPLESGTLAAFLVSLFTYLIVIVCSGCAGYYTAAFLQELNK